jgi:Ser/Thr protein kinase RdoA (MazF antagonist)
LSNWAEAALEQYGLQDARFALLKKDQYKLVFRIESPTRERFLLRIYRGRNNQFTASEEVLRSELLWLQALRREAHLTVPEPIPATDGSLVSYASLDRESKPRRCVLLRWVPGRHKTTDLRPADLSLVGSQVARLHRHSERYAVPEGFARPHVWNWDSTLGEAAPLWNKGESIYSPSELDVFRATAERIRRDLRALGNNSDVFGLIHRDLHTSNLVFRGGKAYVIDFEFCGWGYYLFDLAGMLWALETSYGERCAPMQAAFLKGYWRERPLPKGHRRYLETFMALRVALRVNWVFDGEVSERLPQLGSRFLSNSVEGLKEFLASEFVVSDESGRKGKAFRWLRKFVASDEEARQIGFSSPWWCKPYR